MPLPDALLESMNNFFADYPRATKEYESYFTDNRKLIKLWVDSAVEQLIEELTGTKPKNFRHARLVLNQRLNLGASIPSDLANALNELLASYSVIEAKDYIEYEAGIKGFIKGPLTNFCGAVAAHSGNSAAALMLAATLRSFR